MSQGTQNLQDWAQRQFAIKLSQNQLKKCFDVLHGTYKVRSL